MEHCEDQNTSACSCCAFKERCAIDDNRYSRAQRWKAVAIAYIVPFVLLACTIVVADAFTDDEYLIGGLALGVLIIYYLILFWAKPEVKKTN
jgi:hypothetical protein